MKNFTALIFIFLFITSFTVTVNKKPTQCVTEVYLPENYLTSGDAVNELYIPKIVGNPLNYSFRIFNRWGKAIFETTDIHEGWNGTFDDKPVQPGVYTWNIQFSCEDGKKNYKLTGSVTVFD